MDVHYPVSLERELAPNLSLWLWLVKWIPGDYPLHNIGVFVYCLRCFMGCGNIQHHLHRKVS